MAPILARAVLALILLLGSAGGDTRAARAGEALAGVWPNGATIAAVAAEPVRFPSHSPFSLREVRAGDGDDPRTEAVGQLFLPHRSPGAGKAPAVIMLHGAGGVLYARELTYSRQLAAMGIATLVIDSFGARRDRAQSFIGRLFEITQAMLLADVFAGLRYLAGRPEVDAERVMLVGFSYGAMASVFAAYAQVAERYAPEGRRFAGHVAFYGPCIVRFADPRTTGAPVLMLAGSRDAIVDQRRCGEIVTDLRAGGSPVESIVYQDACTNGTEASRRG